MKAIDSNGCTHAKGTDHEYNIVSIELEKDIGAYKTFCNYDLIISRDLKERGVFSGHRYAVIVINEETVPLNSDAFKLIERHLEGQYCDIVEGEYV